jgi:hypothetical protein
MHKKDVWSTAHVWQYLSFDSYSMSALLTRMYSHGKDKLVKLAVVVCEVILPYVFDVARISECSQHWVSSGDQSDAYTQP